MLQQSMMHTAEARLDLENKEKELGQVRLTTCLRPSWVRSSDCFSTLQHLVLGGNVLSKL
jgi:hypothetical protein